MSIDPKALTLMRLAKRDADPNGWTKVSPMVLPLMEIIPSELIETRLSDDGGFVRLTAQGYTVLEYA
jgi:hypothetical protein